jgi:hypothetical protein
MLSLAKISSSIDNRLSLRLVAAVLALGFAAAGCAPTLIIPTVSEAEARAEAERQREMAFSVAMKREERLFNVGLPLLVAAKEFCDKQVGNIYGFLLTDKMEYRKTYGKDFEEVAARYFGSWS